MPLLASTRAPTSTRAPATGPRHASRRTPRQHSQTRRRAAPAEVEETTDEIVSSIIATVQDSDNGLRLSSQQRVVVEQWVGKLAAIGQTQQPRPLENDLLFGNYVVAFTSSRTTSSDRQSDRSGSAAGGRFRSGLGRVLFQTEGLYQSVLRPDLAVNKVAFKLFGWIPGFVGLRGRVLPEGGDGDTVRVLFEPPVLSLCDMLHFRIGPPSSVVLTTTYLDERVRLGKGSRGSLFVFTRGGAADAADMANVGLQRTTPAGKALLAACLAVMALSGAAMWASGAPAFRVAAAGLWLVTLGVALVLRRGGIEDGNDSAQQWEAYQQQLVKRRNGQPPAAAAAAASTEVE